LDEAEAQLPEFFTVDTDDSEDDEDYTPTISVPRAAHDDEAGTSRDPAPAPPVIAAQVSQPDSLAALLQVLTEEQRAQREVQNRLLAEQARQAEVQMLIF
jgi:hypothetical protein